MSDPTPEARLAAALEKMVGLYGPAEMTPTQYSEALLAALPADAHLFTVDSLAAAVFAADDPNFRFATRGNCERFAAAIIKAAKEASDAP